MKRSYLGDSYDIAKRLWADLLRDWAPVVANPKFIPEELYEDYTRMTGIPILDGEAPLAHSILNDPDTGVRLPDAKNQSEGRTHISIRSILRQLRESGARCVITFDQSNYRGHTLNLKAQRQAKMAFLAEEGFVSFYYVSHASFLFSFPDRESSQKVRQKLTRAGLPDCRLEPARR